MKIIDISNVNGKVNFYKSRLSGVGGVWLKATEGATFDDPLYHANYKAAKKALLRVGAYHFARPDRNSPEVEAAHFMRVVGKLGKRDLRPVLDMEKHANIDLEDWSRRFNRHIKHHWGIVPIFYSYPDFIKNMNLNTTIGNGLWIANYSINDGKRHLVSVPPPWKHYVAHQYTSRGKVLGVKGYVDISYAPKLDAVLAHGKGGE